MKGWVGLGENIFVSQKMHQNRLAYVWNFAQDSAQGFTAISRPLDVFVEKQATSQPRHRHYSVSLLLLYKYECCRPGSAWLGVTACEWTAMLTGVNRWRQWSRTTTLTRSWRSWNWAPRHWQRLPPTRRGTSVLLPLPLVSQHHHHHHYCHCHLFFKNRLINATIR